MVITICYRRTLFCAAMLFVFIFAAACGKEEPIKQEPASSETPAETPQPEGDAYKEETPEMPRYEAMADWATGKLIENYWDDNLKIFVNQHPYNEEDPGGVNYWWKSHAVDAMVDAYERSGDEFYLERAKLGVRMVVMLNGGLYNNFIDDMEWLSLACLRIYDACGDEEFRDYAQNLWKDIKTAWWDDELGGLGWNKEQLHLRNACSNGPAAIIAARMYQRFEDDADLEWAKKIYNFVKTNLQDPETGAIWDGLTVKEDGSLDINKAWVFTYNMGTYIGAAVELYRITGDETYLQDAEKVAADSLERFTNFSTKIFKEEGQGDGGMFKGVLIRYLAELYAVNRDETIRQVIYANAESLRYQGTTERGLFGPGWSAMYVTPLDLTCELSGHFLFEAAAKIERMDSEHDET